MKQFILAAVVLLTAVVVFEPEVSLSQSQPDQQNQPGQGAHSPVWKKRYNYVRAKDGTGKWVQPGSATDMALKTRDPADPVPDTWNPQPIPGFGGSGASVGALCGSHGQGRTDNLDRCLDASGVQIPKY